MPFEASPLIQLALPVEFHIPDSVITRFANQATVQLDQGGCFLSFFETISPLIVGTPEQVKDQAARLTSIRAECVARIYLPAARLQEVLAILQTVQSQLTSLPSQPQIGVTQSEGS